MMSKMMSNKSNLDTDIANREGSNAYNKAKNILLTGVSAVALFVASTGVSGQDAKTEKAPPKAEEEKAPVPIVFEEIVVQGIRKSLANAQNLKREASTFVDAITASDIGALPDRSVSEALQRVPGVSILRFAGPDDPDHFAVEGSGVVVRGLPFVRSELNGRDVFGANAGGALGFEDVSPELLGSVQVFKNQSADLIEGGIAGSIDLRTRLPFDQDGQLISFSAEANYGDLAQDLTPSGSFLYSNNWDTSAGRFGLLANVSYTQLRSRSEATQLANFVPLAGGNQFIPTGGGIRTQDFDRERQATAFAAQWESPDRASLASFQFLRSDSRLLWGEDVLETGVDGSGDPNGFDSTDFVFDDDGILQSGTITDNSQWRGPNATAALFPTQGGQQIGATRERSEQDITTDFGFNFKHIFSDSLRINLDAQYITSEADATDVAVFTSFFSPVRIDRSNGVVPDFSYVIPDGERANYFQDFSNHFLRAMADLRIQNEAEEIAFRADVEYDFSGDSFFKSVRVGARYADQDTNLRESDFNWGAISEVWTGRDISGTADPADSNTNVSTLLLSGNSNPELDVLLDGLFGTVDFNDFQRNAVGDLGLNGPVPAYIGPLTDDYDSFAATRDQIIAALGGAVGSRGACGSPFSSLAGRICTNGDQVIPGTPFINAEEASLSRETFAAYARFDFGTDIGSDGVNLEGNFGLRVVHTERVITTALISPSFESLFQTIDNCPTDGVLPAGTTINSVPGFCSIDLVGAQQVLGNGSVETFPVNVSYTEFLPSLNLKLDLTNGHLLRFAVSRTLSRPDVNQINERPVIGLLPDNRVINADGEEVNNFAGFDAGNSGNANLLPQTSVGIDLSYEWYFAPTGSVTATLFNKVIEDFIAPDLGTVVDANGDPIILNNTSVQFNTSNNSRDNARVRGFEIAYQQFYDFLPEPFNGFGTQFNYTYIDERGVPFSEAAANSPSAPRFQGDQGIISGISEHTINGALLFEKGPWQARTAFNWRSEFQITPRDVIFPFASIYQPATGQLDFSVFYNIDENWKVGIQGVNVLDDITETTQSINESGLRAPRSFFRNDRRFTLIARATF